METPGKCSAESTPAMEGAVLLCRPQLRRFVNREQLPLGMLQKQHALPKLRSALSQVTVPNVKQNHINFAYITS